MDGESVAADDDDDDDAAAVEAKSARGDAAEWGVRGEGIECRRSGMMGRQLEEVEKLLNASQSSTTQVEQDSATHKAEIKRLQGELDKATNHAKEEEERRAAVQAPPQICV